jgi:hypothetical protein
MARVYRRALAAIVSSGTLDGEVARPHALFKTPALRSRRLALLLSQEALAAKARVARSAITNLEDGGVARAATIRKLAEALEIEPAELMRQPPAT